MRYLAMILGLLMSVSISCAPGGGGGEIPYAMVFPGANSRETYFSLHDIRQAQNVATGEGVKVGILDHLFGLEEHGDLYAGGKNFLGEDQAWKLNTTAEHGYWMALTLREIAPDVEIFALNISSKDQKEKIAAIERAIDWAIEQGIDVLTYSSRGFLAEHREQIDSAVERAHSAGIVTVFIHYGHQGNILPSGLWEGEDDGREPDVHVLHNDYTVLFVHEHAKLERGEPSDWYKPFLSVSSTSQVTGGVVAIMLSIRPQLSPADCQRVLIESSRTIQFNGKSIAKSLDAAAAVDAVKFSVSEGQVSEGTPAN